MSTQSPAGHAKRLDIQGLRAVAVLVVMAAHAELPVPGGFIGVDVFFVISGFVITAMLMREWNRTGRVSLSAFYLRRFKRLTPALVVTVVAAMVVATLVLPPFGPQQAAAKTGIGALLLCANWVISQVNGAYFGAAARVNPLLHTWSLSVEEQFYLVFPLLIVGSFALGRRLRYRFLPAGLMVTLVGCASLASGRMLPSDSWLIGYFSPVNRAWEFAAGAIVAFLVTGLKRLPTWVATAGGLVGIGAIAASLWLITPATPFPGKAAFLPVGGAALVLASGSVGTSLVSRALASRPMVAVGDWSYSLYLWHWPAVVVAEVLFPLTPWALVAATSISVLPAIASYYWVENPFRALRVSRTRLLGLGATILATALAVAGGTLVAANNFWAPGYLAGTLTVEHRAESGSLYELGVPCDPAPTAALDVCLQSKPHEPLQVAVVGDSHAQVLFHGLAAQYPDLNVGVFVQRRPTFFGTAEDQESLTKLLESSLSLRVVIVARYWESQGLSNDNEASLRALMARLAVSKVRFVLPEDVPNWPFDATQCRYQVAPVVPMVRCGEPNLRGSSDHLLYTSKLQRIVAETPGAIYVPSFPPFCDEVTCSMLDAKGDVLFMDDNHLDATGSRHLASYWAQEPAFRDVIQGARAR